MDVQLKFIGVSLIILAMIHVIFPRYFNWKIDLAPLSLINRQLMHVHTFFVALVVFLMGLFCLTSTHDIIHTRLGHEIALGFAIFWCIRLVFQLFVYSSIHWLGKRFETVVHIVLTLFWTYLTVSFFMIYWGSGLKISSTTLFVPYPSPNKAAPNRIGTTVSKML